MLTEMKIIIRIVILHLVLLTSSYAQTATSKVNPQVLPKGEKGSYQITLDGTSTGKEIGGSLPSVKGLKITGGASTSTQMQFINGRARHQITYSFPIIGEELGTFTVPAWDMHFGNKIIPIPATTVKIVDTKDVYNGVFELELTLDKPSYYVGELIKGELKLWVRNGIEARLSDSLEKIGDAFVQESLEEISWQITPVVRNGLRYEMAKVELYFTAIKPGLQTLRYKLPIFARVPNPQTRLRDPFFDDFFPGRNRFKEIMVETQEKKWEIKPLPAKGKPESFSGAVGKFKADVTYGPKQVTAGEPVTLKVSISGKGNFDRIQAPKLVNTEDHKVYPPKIEFQPTGGNTNKTGIKTFEYIVIPKHEDADQLMEIPFVYFDPEPGIYVDISQKPLEMVVLPSPMESAFNEPVLRAPTNNNIAQNQTQRLLPIQTISGKWQHPGQRSFWTPGYICVHASSFALIIGVLLIRKRQIHLANNSDLQHKLTLSKEAKEWHQKTQDALIANELANYIEAARKTIQLSISKEVPGKTSDALTIEDVRDQMSKMGIEENKINEAKAIFDAADLMKFAGSQGKEIDINALNQSLTIVLNSLS